MRRRRSWLVVALAAAVLVAGIPAGLVFWNLPDRHAGRIAGLSGPVQVGFDDRGVPHVVAATLRDALRAQGWLTARERAFQLELLRRASAGELAELFGKVALPSDRAHRTYGFARVAAAAAARLPPEERADLQALADGINAYLVSHRGRAGVKLTVFRLPPHTWTPADTLLVLLLMHEDLSSSWKIEVEAERLANLPRSLREFLMPPGTADDVTLVPDAAPLAMPGLPDIGAGRLAASAGVAVSEREGYGSNSWVVSGTLNKSGKPLLANDPHLGLTIPGIWLPMCFEIGGRPVEGVTLPGLPGVILGRNAHLAWGFTNLMTDVQDVYTEEISGDRARWGAGFRPVVSRMETIAVKGAPSERLVVKETPHGPLMDETHALRWLALDPANVRLATGTVMLSATPDELMKGLDDYVGPTQNVVFATADGTIGWRAAGLVPIRRPGTDGSLPYDGTDPQNDWRGVVPAAEMPRVVNPPAGYIATANQRTIGTTYPHVIATDWPSPSRARRIRDLLEAAKREGRRLDRDAMEVIQHDMVSAAIRGFVQPFLPHLPAELAERFRAWDGGARAGDDLMLVARTLRAAFRDRALKSWGVASYSRSLNEDLWNALASADDAAFQRAGLGARRAFLDACVVQAMADLSKRFGKDERRWSWGEADRLAVRHPLGYVPGLAWLFDPPHPPQSGSGGTVKASSPAYGPSTRFVVDWGEPEKATLVVPFGVSAHVGSPHRTDQLRFWLSGDPGGGATRLERPIVETLELLPEMTGRQTAGTEGSVAVRTSGNPWTS